MNNIIVEFDYTIEMAHTAIIEASKSVDKFGVLVPWLGFMFALIGSGLFFILNIYVVETFIAGFIFLLTACFMRWELWRRAKRLININNHYKWEINDKELKSSTEGSETRFVWEKLFKIHEREEGFLLFTQKHLAYWLPKKGFKSEADIELFCRLVKSKPLKFVR